MLRIDLPVSLKISFSVSPPSRLMPLNDASWAVVVIWARMSLYWVTRLLRMVWAVTSATGACGVDQVNAVVTVPPITPPAVNDPRVEEAIVVAGGDHQLAGRIDRRLQELFACKRGVQLIQRLDRTAGAVAEGDIDRGAAIEGGEGQGLAVDAADSRGTGSIEGAAGAGRTVETESGQRVADTTDNAEISRRTGAELQRAVRVHR